jgi:hypothetical protein
MKKIFAIVILSAGAMGMFGCKLPKNPGDSGGSMGPCVCGVPSSACGSC